MEKPWVVEQADKISCGQIEMAHVPSLLKLLDGFHISRKASQIIEIVSSIFNSLDEKELPLESQQLLHGYLGVALIQTGKPSKAIEHLRFARRLQPIQQLVRVNDEIFANYHFLGEYHIRRATEFSNR